MASPYSPATPDTQQVRLRVMDEQVDLTRWTSYSFASNFLTPCDGWSATIGDGDLEPRQRNALRVGARVRLYVDNFPLAEGYLDRIEIGASRSSGVTYRIHGRDALAPVVDAIADPRMQFKTGVTFAEFLKQLLEPYGWVNDSQFMISNAANRDAKTGGLRGVPTSKGGKRKPPRPLKDHVLHHLKPHNHEGLFRFISRVAERFGVLVRVSADGEQIIAAGPEFRQEHRYQLRRRNDGTSGRNGGTNILDGTAVYDATDQPSIIVADGFSGGGEFGRGKIKAYCVNPCFGLDEGGVFLPDVQRVIDEYPEASPVLFPAQSFERRVSNIPHRPAYLHDEESKTAAQLEWFLRRTMSELLRKSLVCHYTVEGHGQVVNGAFTPWDIDTIVEVQDEVAGVDEDMYVLSRTFEKSRSGTFTRLELIRKFSIAGGDPESLRALLQEDEGLVNNTPKASSGPIKHHLTETR